MSNLNPSGSSEFAIDLDVHFLPAWAQRSSTENQYAKYEGRGGSQESERRGDRSPWRGPGDRRREGGPPQERRFGAGGGPRREGGRPFQKGGRYEGPREEPREPLAPPIQLNVNLVPEEKGVEALARQIKLTGRAYPLFDIGHLILKKPDRYDVQLSVIKGPDGKPVQPMFACELDETLWLSEQEAVDYVLSKHFPTFYQTDKVPTDPPKGVYTFVAQCGMSGTILGPPNYHDYQNKLRKLHQERFARMPFEAFKSRVKIVKDEAVVKKWIEEQSCRFEYTCLNVPDAIKLNSREEVEKHFRETHFANVIKPVESRTLSGSAVQNQPHHALRNGARRAWEEQNRFPLKLVNVLSQQFATHGLQFFKFNKNVTFVTVARPRFLDMEATPVSANVERIVHFIRNTPRCTRRKLIDALAPASAPPTPAQPAPSEAAAAPAAEGSSAVPAEAPAAPPTADLADSRLVTAINGDLHWLIHQGHVIEFANGILELARKPAPRPPPKVVKKPVPATTAAESPVTASLQPPAEGSVGESIDPDAMTADSEADTTAAPDGASVASEETASAPDEPSQAEQVNLSTEGSTEEESNAMDATAANDLSQPLSADETKAERVQAPMPAS